jgi:energy-converting hydrogenase B subunit D
MNALIVAALVLVAAGAVAVVCTEDPARQAVTLAGFGFTLAVLFAVLQAPDVALSELGVGGTIVPLLVMLTLRKIGDKR